MRLKPLLSFGLKVSISAGLLAFVFSQVPLALVAGATASASSPLLALTFVAFLLLNYVAAWKLYYLIQPQKIIASPSKLLEINLTSQFYACILPFGSAAGAVVRWYKLSAIDGQRAQAFAAVVLNRILEFLMVSGICGTAWLLDSNPDRFPPVGAVACGFFLAFVIAYLISCSATMLRWSRKFLKSLALFLPALCARIEKIFAALTTYPRLSLLQHLRLLAISFTRSAIIVLALYFLAMSLDMGISLVTAAWIRSATALLTFLPLSVFGLGVREISLIFLLRPYEVPEASAVALGILWLVVNVCMALIGGILELWKFIGRSRRATGSERTIWP
jgi:uncharacterized protein (TIRG00374 family)